jgi:DNA-binding transcriptional LysR family regulator
MTASFRRLEVFVAAVEAASFRECGDRLGVSHVAISNHIRSLEAQIGKRLFARARGGRAALTNEGSRIYQLARELLERADELSGGNVLPRRTACPQRQVRLGIHGYLALILARPIARFIQDHPEIHLVVRTESYENIVDGLAAGALDLGYFFSLGDVVELQSKCVWTEPMGLYASPSHSLSQLETISPAALARHPLAALPPDPHLRQLVMSALREIGVIDPVIVFETENFTLAAEAVLIGIGFGCFFRRAGTCHPVAAQLQCLRMRVPDLGVHLSISPMHRLDPAVQSLTTHIAREGQSDLLSWTSIDCPLRPGIAAVLSDDAQKRSAAISSIQTARDST